jgi:hypothetical protein
VLLPACLLACLLACWSSIMCQQVCTPQSTCCSVESYEHRSQPFQCLASAARAFRCLASGGSLDRPCIATAGAAAAAAEFLIIYVAVPAG